MKDTGSNSFWKPFAFAVWGFNLGMGLITHNLFILVVSIIVLIIMSFAHIYKEQYGGSLK